jgi:hypothetical protein
VGWRVGWNLTISEIEESIWNAPLQLEPGMAQFTDIRMKNVTIAQSEAIALPCLMKLGMIKPLRTMGHDSEQCDHSFDCVFAVPSSDAP